MPPFLASSCARSAAALRDLRASDLVAEVRGREMRPYRHIRRERWDRRVVHPARPGELPDALVQVAALLRSGHYGTARRLRLEARGLYRRVDEVLLACDKRADDALQGLGLLVGLCWV